MESPLERAFAYSVERPPVSRFPPEGLGPRRGYREDVDLRHELDRAQRCLDTAEVILLALDGNGSITLINRKGRDLLGWADEALLGCEWTRPACQTPECRLPPIDIVPRKPNLIAE
jgi:hypothetical protein